MLKFKRKFRRLKVNKYININRRLGGPQSVWTYKRTFRSRISAFMLSWFSVACQGKWRGSTSGGPSSLLPIHHWRSPYRILRPHLLYSWNSVIEWACHESCSYFNSRSTRRGNGKANRSVVDGKNQLEQRFDTSGLLYFTRLAKVWGRSQASPFSMGTGFLSMSIFLCQYHRGGIVSSIDSVVE